MYFCTVVAPYFEYFLVFFVKFTSAFISQIFRETFASMEPLYILSVNMNMEKNCCVFRENGESGNKIISHCLNSLT